MVDHMQIPVWIKNKKAKINPINKKETKRFQYLITVTLNHEETEKDLQRIRNIKAFTDKYNWEGKNYPS